MTRRIASVAAARQKLLAAHMACMVMHGIEQRQVGGQHLFRNTRLVRKWTASLLTYVFATVPRDFTDLIT